MPLASQAKQAASQVKTSARPASFNIIAALDDERLFKPWFRGPSWNNWRTVLKAAYGLPLTDDETVFFKSIAGGRAPPDRQVRELWIVAGRRAGKDAIASVIAAFSAALFDQQDRLRPGERGLIACLACDRNQSRIILDYTRAFFSIPMLADLVTRSTAIGFQLRNLIDIEIATNNFKSVRGRPFAVAILDECAFYLSETSATPDEELYKAIVPGMATLPNSMLVGISSPYRKGGLLYKKFREHFGQDGDVLVVKSPTTILNPTIDPAIVARALEEDPAAAKAEWLGEFRDDIDGYVTRESIEAVTSWGVFERGFIPGMRYFAFCDPSGGAADSMTLAIGHLERGKIESQKTTVLDAIRERRAPFSPENVVDEFVKLLQIYKITAVVGDRYGSAWVSERFKIHGIKYEPAEKPKSDLYKECLPAINSAQVDFLDHPRMLAQFVSLERRTARGGRDTIDHPPHGHDDVSNAVAGLCCLIRADSNATKTRMVRIDFMSR